MNRVRETRHSNNIPAIHTRHNYFQNLFIPVTISERNNLDFKIRNSGNLSNFRKNLLNFIRPCGNSIFNIHNPYGIKLPTRLHLSLSHLCNHKFRQCFQDNVNPLYGCGNDTEKTAHFFLHCPSFQTPRLTRLKNFRDINEDNLSCGEDQLIQTFLYGNYNLTVNRVILNATIEHLISAERFKCYFFK